MGRWNEDALMIHRPPPPDSGHTYEPSRWELAVFWGGLGVIVSGTIGAVVMLIMKMF